MTFTAPSSRVLAPSTDSRPALAVLALLGLCLGMCAGPAAAKQSDRSKPVNVNASSADATAQPNGTSHLKGHVEITQGTLKATGSHGTVYFDARSEVERVVLTGSPARVQQEDDNGNIMHGHAARIDYNVPGGIAILTGDASVKLQGRGSASGDRLVYNTRTSVMSAQSHGDNRVHLTFKPRQQAAASPAPKKTSRAAAAGGTHTPSPSPAGSAMQPAAARSTN